MGRDVARRCDVVNELCLTALLHHEEASNTRFVCCNTRNLKSNYLDTELRCNNCWKYMWISELKIHRIVSQFVWVHSNVYQRDLECYLSAKDGVDAVIDNAMRCKARRKCIIKIGKFKSDTLKSITQARK